MRATSTGEPENTDRHLTFLPYFDEKDTFTRLGLQETSAGSKKENTRPDLGSPCGDIF